MVILFLQLCGLPASGKSTTAKALCNALNNRRHERYAQQVGSGNNVIASLQITCEIVSFDDELLLQISSQASTGKRTTTKFATAADADVRTTSSSSTTPSTSTLAATSISSSSSSSTTWSPELWHASRAQAFERLHSIIAHRGKDRSNKPHHSHHHPDCTESSSVLSGEENHVHVVIVDDNAWIKSMRRHTYQIARNAGAAYICIYFPISVEEAIRRDSERPVACRVGREVIQRMALVLEPPASSAASSSSASSCLGSSSTMHTHDTTLPTTATTWESKHSFSVPPLPLPHYSSQASTGPEKTTTTTTTAPISANADDMDMTTTYVLDFLLSDVLGYQHILQLTKPTQQSTNTTMKTTTLPEEADGISEPVNGKLQNTTNTVSSSSSSSSSDINSAFSQLKQWIPVNYNPIEISLVSAADREKTSKSMLHYADLYLREKVSRSILTQSKNASASSGIIPEIVAVAGVTGKTASLAKKSVLAILLARQQKFQAMHHHHHHQLLLQQQLHGQQQSQEQQHPHQSQTTTREWQDAVLEDDLAQEFGSIVREWNHLQSTTMQVTEEALADNRIHALQAGSRVDENDDTKKLPKQLNQWLNDQFDWELLRLSSNDHSFPTPTNTSTATATQSTKH